MAVQHETVGATLVKYQSGAESLGYTRDGANIRIEPRFIEIPSDDFGGQSGAPADEQLVGVTAQITLELTKFDKANCRKLTAFSGAGTAWTLPVLGTLIRQGSKTASLLLDGVNEDWTFAQAFPKTGIETNIGTRFSTFHCGFEAWIDSASSRVLASIA